MSRLLDIFGGHGYWLVAIFFKYYSMAINFAMIFFYKESGDLSVTKYERFDDSFYEENRLFDLIGLLS